MPSFWVRKIFQQGEGVQTTRLGACASHIYEVQKFFKVMFRFSSQRKLSEMKYM